MAYLEPNRVHHVRDYAHVVIDRYRTLDPHSWSAAALEPILRTVSAETTGKAFVP